MYGAPSGFTQAMRIGFPRARNASFSSSDIPRTLPRQALPVIRARLLPRRPGRVSRSRSGRLAPTPAGPGVPTSMNAIETDALTRSYAAERSVVDPFERFVRAGP